MEKNQEAKSNEELEILLGGRQVTLSTDEEVTVREYGGFLEGMRVDAIAAPMLEDLRQLFDTLANGGDFSIQALSSALGSHPEVMVKLLAISCDKPEEWITSLSDDDGQLLLMVWWSANQSFFLRRLAKDRMARQAAEEVQASRDGEKSSAA